MFRIVRTTTLTRLLDAERAGVIDAAEAEKWQRLYGEESARADDAEVRNELLLRDLARAHADHFKAEAALKTDAARIRKESEAALAGIHQDVARLQKAVADPVTGTEGQRSLALSVLRTLLERAKAEAEASGEDLDPFFRLVGVLILPSESATPTGD